MIDWIKVSTRIFEDEKTIYLQSLPEGDSLVLMWIRVLVQAGRCNDGGRLSLTPEIPYDEDMLVNVLRQPQGMVKKSFALFVKLGLLDLEDGTYCVANWSKYQNVDGMMKCREQNRQRVAAYRERHRREKKDEGCNVTCNVGGNGHVMEEVMQTGKSGKKTKAKSDAKEIVIDEVDVDYRVALEEFVEYRRKVKKPLTRRGYDLLIASLQGEPVETRIKLIQQSIMNGWTGVFPDKAKRVGKKSNEGNFSQREVSKEEWQSMYDL